MNLLSLPPGYYSEFGRCPVCARMLVETDRIDGEPVWSCPDRCGQLDDGESEEEMKGFRERSEPRNAKLATQAIGDLS